MAKGLLALETSWKRLLTTEKVIETLNPSRIEDFEPPEIPQNHSKSDQTPDFGYFGGLLNNLNDPKKRVKRDYSLPRPRKPREIDLDMDEISEAPSLSQALVCRGFSSSQTNLRKREKRLISPCHRLKPILIWDDSSKVGGELSVTMGRIPVKYRLGGREKPRKRVQGMGMTSTGVGTSDHLEEAMGWRREKTGIQAGSLGSTPQHKSKGRSLVSKWLDHMLTQQPHVRGKGSRSMVFTRVRKSPASNQLKELLTSYE